MKKAAALLFGAVSYAGCLAVFAYLAGFLSNLWVPRSVDRGPETAVGLAFAVNVGLVVLLGLQHSIMARPTFKKWWTRFIPEPIERSTYVLCSNVVFILMFWQWRPIESVIWNLSSGPARTGMWLLHASGWTLVLASTFFLNHFDLFGLRQVWLYATGEPYTRLKFGVPAIYGYVRHTLYVGWLTVFWATPTMTAGHFLLAGTTSAYILIAIWFEERNLIETHGSAYEEYRRKVPMFIPRPNLGRFDSGNATEAA